MNIYFVNRQSRWKGPFDVIDAQRRHILNIGDFCIRDTDNGLHLLLIENDKNTWSSCKEFGLGKNQKTTSVGNTQLFSFDGIHQRRGNRDLLKILIDCFSQGYIKGLLTNAIDILDYKRDYWDVIVFKQLYNPSSPIPKAVEEDKTVSQDFPKKAFPSIFSSYFDDNILNKLLTLLNNGKTLREAYTAIRETNRDEFRSAFIRFLNENPEKTIYDTFPPEDSTIDWFLTDISFINEVPQKENNSSTRETTTSMGISEPGWDDLGIECNNSKSLKIFLNEVSQYPILTDKQTFELFSRWHGNEDKVFDFLVKSNMRHVLRLAQFYKREGVELEDLIQEGSIGLIHAIRKFDHTLGFGFYEYAKRGIIGAIYNSLNTLPYSIKIPINALSNHKELNRILDKQEQEFEYEPSPLNIEYEGADEGKPLPYYYQLPYDLNTITESVENMDCFIGDGFNPEEGLMAESRKFKAHALLDQLSQRDAKILKGYFGIDGEEKTLEEMGDRLHLTRERVRQIKEKALRIIKGKVGIVRKKKVEERIEEISLPSGNAEINASTPLKSLVKKGLLKKKECKHCRRDKLETIGDVQRVIMKYNLTRDSSRFTQYTLNIWFKIIDLLSDDINAKKEDIIVKKKAEEKKVVERKPVEKKKREYKKRKAEEKKIEEKLAQSKDEEASVKPNVTKPTKVVTRNINISFDVRYRYEDRKNAIMNVMHHLTEPKTLSDIALLIDRVEWGGAVALEIVEAILNEQPGVQKRVDGKYYWEVSEPTRTVGIQGKSKKQAKTKRRKYSLDILDNEQLQSMLKLFRIGLTIRELALRFDITEEDVIRQLRLNGFYVKQ